jgi:hypothetical protein
MRKDPTLGNPLGLMARLNLVAIHPDLDEHYGWKDAPGAAPRRGGMEMRFDGVDGRPRRVPVDIDYQA